MEENQIMGEELEPKKSRKGLWIALGVILGIILIAVVIIIWPKVFQKTQEFHMELGESLTTDINDYVRGDEKLIAAASLDISGVDQTKAGDYEATVTYTLFLFNKEKTYTYLVSIVDTIAPSVEVVAAPFYVGQGQHYAPSDFITKCEDASNDVTLYLVGEPSNIVTSNTLGTFEFQIGAKDPSDNETIVTVTVEVDTVPQFINAKNEKWFALKEEGDILSDVLAYDEAEGLLLTSVYATNADEFNAGLETARDCNLHYVVTDSHGISNETDVLVHIMDSEDKIPENYSRGLSKEDLTILCNYDYFSYQPLAEGNYDDMLALIEPCLFDMWKGLTQKQIEQGYTGQYSGSGFIMDITPDYIYAITDEHCVKDMHDRTNFIFFNRYQLSDCEYESITTYKMKGYGGDASLFCMNVYAIPSTTLLKLKKASISQEPYDALENGQQVVAYAKFWKSKDDRITTHKVTNTNGFYERWPGKLLLTTSGFKPGMSGTGVFDMKGNLVGVCYATFTNNGVTENWSAPVDAVIYLSEHREELDGKKVAGLK